MVAKFKDYRKLVGELLIGLVQKVKGYNRYIVRIFKTYLVGGAVYISNFISESDPTFLYYAGMTTVKPTFEPPPEPITVGLLVRMLWQQI